MINHDESWIIHQTPDANDWSIQLDPPRHELERFGMLDIIGAILAPQLKQWWPFQSFGTFHIGSSWNVMELVSKWASEADEVWATNRNLCSCVWFRRRGVPCSWRLSPRQWCGRCWSCADLDFPDRPPCSCRVRLCSILSLRRHLHIKVTVHNDSRELRLRIVKELEIVERFFGILVHHLPIGLLYELLYERVSFNCLDRDGKSKVLGEVEGALWGGGGREMKTSFTFGDVVVVGWGQAQLGFLQIVDAAFAAQIVTDADGWCIVQSAHGATVGRTSVPERVNWIVKVVTICVNEIINQMIHPMRHWLLLDRYFNTTKILLLEWGWLLSPWLSV